MPGTVEDKRQAVGMAATLSAQLITAALGMIALQGAYIAFAADKKQCGIGFWLLMLLAFLVFIASVFCAGKGTAKLYKRGSEGDWDPSSAKDHFVSQTLLCFLGIFLFIFAVCTAPKDKSSETEAVQKELETIVQALRKQSATNEQVLSQLRTNSINAEFLTQLNDLKRRLDQLEDQSARLKQPPSRTKARLRPKPRSSQTKQ